jgi:DNA-binding CsgD family transcriptional regulator
MSWPRQRDFHAIMEIVERLYSYQTLDACEAGIVESLQRVMDCDSWHLSESDPKRRRVRWTSDWASRRPETIPNPNEVVARYMHEHPFLRRWKSHREDLKPVTLSDLISRPSWHDTGLYNEIYRPIRIEHMLGVALPGFRSHAVHVVGLRETLDFGDRDRRVLDLLAPHLAAVYRNAEAVGELQTQLATLHQGLEANGRAAILLGPGRRIRQMSARARDLLTSHFRWSDRSALPAPVDGWLRRQGLTVDASVAPLRPLVVERDGRRLTIQVLRDHRGAFLLLSERKLRIAPSDIASLGLSPRETEVLAWLAHGKSNAEIAGILGLSPATIKHCLERVYGKLDVGTRAAATAVAVAAAGTHG